MRRLALLVLVALLPACHSTTQIVVGILTNLQVPSQLTTVRLEAFRNGVPVGGQEGAPQLWPLSGKKGVDFTLPGTFGFFSTRGGMPEVELELAGFVGEQQVLTRHSLIQLVVDEQLFYRMALVQSCEGVSCPPGSGCIEGACRPDVVDPRVLPSYDRALALTVQCDSGSDFIDTSTCSTGTCAKLPVTGPACATDEVCREGTCDKSSAP